MKNHFLSSVFQPSSIAVIGASSREQSMGLKLLSNIRNNGFEGDIYPVNTKYQEIDGLPCYDSVKAIDHPVELAVIAVPASSIVPVMRECAEVGVKAAVVVSAGFAEAGKPGVRRQSEIVDIARTHNIVLVGPNCMGVIRPGSGVNTTFLPIPVRRGRTALVAQSASLVASVLDMAHQQGLGFSAVASLGATAGVGFGEVLDYLAVDPQTESIMLCIEGVHNARGFYSGLRVAARLKPVIVLKAGRSGRAARTIESHFGNKLGSDDVFDAAIKRAGAVRVRTVTELFSTARLLVSGSRVDGARLAIVTNGGGLGLMAADRAQDLDVPMARLGDETVAKIKKIMPAKWSPSVPVDILRDASPAVYGAATEAVLADEGVDGVLVMLSPQAETDATGAAEALVEVAARSQKPVLACWLGGDLVDVGRQRLAAANIPKFRTPEAGVEAFSFLARYRYNQKALLQAPGPLAPQDRPDVDGARMIIEHALSDRRQSLSNIGAKAVLRAFGINISPSINVTSAADALVAAESLGLPVAMKINSPDILMKTDVGGVRLNIGEPQRVRTAFRELMEEVARIKPEARLLGVTVEPMQVRPHAREIMIHVDRDPVFGPVISFGVGGTEAEIFADASRALPPLNDFLARALIEETRAARYLRKFRNLPAADVDQVVKVLLRVSEMTCELPEMQELHINPLLADESMVIATDAHMVVNARLSGASRYAHMAIHPYPVELISRWQLSDGTDVVIRPIRPEDALIEQAFVQNLSPESKYMRFMQSLKKLTPIMLARFTQIDYTREMALIAVVKEGTDDAHALGVGRYETNPDQRSCEFALTISDEVQRQGIGQELMRRLMGVARSRNIDIMEGEVLSSNRRMLSLCERLGFHLYREEDSDVVHVRRHLQVI